MEGTKNKLSVIPTNTFRTCTTEYSETWVDDSINGAYYNLARNDFNYLMPHCLLMGMYGSQVSKYDLFVLAAHARWRIDIMIFETDEDMKCWMEDFGSEKIFHYVYVNE